MIAFLSSVLFVALWLMHDDPLYVICALIVWGVERITAEIRARGKNKSDCESEEK